MYLCTRIVVIGSGAVNSMRSRRRQVLSMYVCTFVVIGSGSVNSMRSGRRQVLSMYVCTFVVIGTGAVNSMRSRRTLAVTSAAHVSIDSSAAVQKIAYPVGAH